MARPSLKANVAKKADTAKAAAEVAKRITGQGAAYSAPSVGENVEYETVSYNLPLDLIDLYRDLAAARHRIDQAAKRDLRRRIKAAKKAGKPLPMEAPQQARQSASAIVREAMEAHRHAVEAELRDLEGK